MGSVIYVSASFSVVNMPDKKTGLDDDSTSDILLQLLVAGIISVGGILLLTWMLACLGVTPCRCGTLPWG